MLGRREASGEGCFRGWRREAQIIKGQEWVALWCDAMQKKAWARMWKRGRVISERHG